MGSNHNTPAEVDPAALEHARHVWHGFTQLAKFAILAAIGVLGLMAVFLL